MSSSAPGAIVDPDSTDGSNGALNRGQPVQEVQHKNYKGFVAGVFSGVAKLSGTNVLSQYKEEAANLGCSRPPFRYHQSSVADKREVSIQRASGLLATNSPKGRFTRIIQRCHTTTSRMDVYGFHVRENLCSSLRSNANIRVRMLGSLTFYRRLLNDNVFSNPVLLTATAASTNGRNDTREGGTKRLPTIGHAVAGIMAGATVSFIAGKQNSVHMGLMYRY